MASNTNTDAVSRNTDNAQKNKALEMAVQAIEKQFGKGSIMRLGEGESLVQDVPVVPTGSLSLDLALGIGGYARGRIVEIYGPESSGKTTLTLHAIAECQKQGGVAAFIDAEHALDVAYARKLGVRTDDLLISQPDTGEQALEIADMLVRSGSVDLLVVDSVAALVPRAEIEGEMGDSHMGLQARLMSQALRKLTGSINRSKTLVIFINQIRMKIGVMFGNPETTTGGNALKFYASMRLDIRRIGAIKDGDNVIGNRTRVKVVKNKLAPPFKEVEFDILYGEGISKEGDLLDLAANMNIIEKSGTWYTYKDERLGQGRDNARNYLKDRPQILKEVRDAVLLKAGVGPQALAAAAAAKAAAGATTTAPAALGHKESGATAASTPNTSEAAVAKAKVMAAAAKASSNSAKK
ncbi:MAG: recombinase RecA [Cryobacterium sp.]|nr:recombinase RecA [Oligoflexia bacterium]